MERLDPEEPDRMISADKPAIDEPTPKLAMDYMSTANYYALVQNAARWNYLQMINNTLKLKIAVYYHPQINATTLNPVAEPEPDAVFLTVGLKNNVWLAMKELPDEYNANR